MAEKEKNKKSEDLAGRFDVLVDELARLTERVENLEAAQPAAAEPEPERPDYSEEEQPLVDAALEAYGVAREHCLRARVREGVVTIWTNGGKRVSWREGMEVQPLEEIEITGVNRRLEKRKVIAGAPRRKQ